MRKMFTNRCHHLQDLLLIVERQAQQAGLPGPGGLERIGTGGVAIEHFDSKLSEQGHIIGIKIQNGGLYAVNVAGMLYQKKG